MKKIRKIYQLYKDYIRVDLLFYVAAFAFMVVSLLYFLFFYHPQ